MLARVGRNTVAISIGTSVRLSIGFIVTPILIRSLGPDAYGVWSLVSAFSITGYLTLLTLGLQGILVRDLAGAVARNDQIAFRRAASASLLIFVGAGVVGATLLVFLATVGVRVFNIPSSLLPTAQTLLVLLALQTLVDFPSLLLDGILEARQQYTLRTALETGRLAVFSAAMLFAIRLGLGLEAFGMIAIAVSSLSAVIVFLLLVRTAPSALRIERPDLREVRRMLGDTTGLLAIRLNSVVYSQMDRTILAAVVSTTAITHYDIAARVNGFALIPQSLPATVTYPAASAAAAVGDESGLRRLFVVVARYAGAGSALVTVGLMILAEDLIRHWIGPAYREDAALARIALIYPMLWATIPVGWNIVLAMRQLGSLVRIQFATTLVNLVLSLLLVHDLGVAGVLLGTTIGNTFAAGLYFPLFLRTLKLPASTFIRSVLIPAYLPALIAGIPLGVAVNLRPADSLLETGLYFGGYLVLGGFVFLWVTAEADLRTWLRSRLQDRMG